MPQQVHAKATTQPAASNATTDADIDQAVAEATERDRSLVDMSDELLDEIDACLEENVLEVLVSFVQKGGE